MKLTLFFCLIFSTFLCVSLSPRVSLGAAEVPTSLSFQTLNTPHFEIIFQKSQKDVAELYAEKLEASYQFLAKVFPDRPQKTIVVINDRTDVTNGYATRLPYPHIMAFPVMPGSSDLVFEYNDWALELLGHEYTHILTFEPAGGVMVPLRKIFGSVIAPNMLLPTWWKEGIAVEMETSMNSYGRSMSTYQDATVRALVSKNKLTEFDISRANEILPVWPYGSTPYLFGSLFFSEIHKRQPIEDLGQLTQQQGARAPYWINTPAKEILGGSYEFLYAKAMNETQERAQEQIRELNTLAPTKFDVLHLRHHPQASNAMISPDGKHMALIAIDSGMNRKILIFNKETQDFKLTPEISKSRPDFLLDLNSPGIFVDHEVLHKHEDPHESPPEGSIQKIVWSPDSQYLYYNKIDSSSLIESYSDLYRFNAKTQKSEKLTDRLRGREPALSPSQKSIAFIKLSAARTELALLELESKKVTSLLKPALQVRLSSPLFISETEIVFSQKEPVGGQESLYIHNLVTNTTRPVLTQFEASQALAFTKHGLLFSSTANGTRNIYLADEKIETAKPISHTLTAFTSASLDETTQNVWATQMSSEGPEIVRFPFQVISSQLPVITPMWSELHPRPANLISTTSSPITTTTEDYEASKYLWPSFWIPFISTSSSGEGVNLSLQTFNFDPLKKHSYSLNISYNSTLNKGTAYGNYENNTTELGIGVSSGQDNYYYGTIDNLISSTENTLYLIPDVFKYSKYLTVQLGVTHNEQGPSQNIHQSIAPFVIALYSTASQSGQQISAESGMTAALDLRNEFSIQKTTPHEELSGNITVYESRILPHRHALMAHLSSFIIPRTVPFNYGVVSTGSSPSEGAIANFSLRGSENGQFLGRKMNSLNFEYRLPIKDIYSGSGTDPFFIDRMTGALTADFLSVEGIGYNFETKTYKRVDLDSPFASFGIEGRFEFKLGYFLPFRFIYGYYLPAKNDFGMKAAPGMQLQMGGVF